MTDATGTGAAALTLIADEAVLPSLEAVTDTFPAATALTSPDAETVAIAEFAELQATTRPVRTLLFASLVTAESCTDDPTWRLAVAGVTDTEATGIGVGALTVKLEELLLPSLVALITALPGPFATMFPAGSTVATFMLEVAHVTVRSEIRFPVESISVAVATAV